MIALSAFLHPTAEIAPDASIGERTRIWREVQIREGASIGDDCILGKGVYIDARVRVGSRVKIHNYASVFEGVTLEDGVFIGPHVCFTNDRFPRAITGKGELKGAEEWTITPTRVCYGASLGAGAVICCGVTIGPFALVGAGAVVTRAVPAHTLVLGNPARPRGYVCSCARPLKSTHEAGSRLFGICAQCGPVELQCLPVDRP